MAGEGRDAEVEGGRGRAGDVSRSISPFLRSSTALGEPPKLGETARPGGLLRRLGDVLGEAELFADVKLPGGP